MDDTNVEELVYESLEDVIPAYVELAGEGFTRRIITDVLSGKKVEFAPTTGGHDVDFTQTLELILTTVGTVASVLQLTVQLKEREEKALRDEQAFIKSVTDQLGSDEEVRRIATSIYRRRYKSFGKRI